MANKPLAFVPKRCACCECSIASLFGALTLPTQIQKVLSGNTPTTSADAPTWVWDSPAFNVVGTTDGTLNPSERAVTPAAAPGELLCWVTWKYGLNCSGVPPSGDPDCTDCVEYWDTGPTSLGRGPSWSCAWLTIGRFDDGHLYRWANVKQSGCLDNDPFPPTFCGQSGAATSYEDLGTGALSSFDPWSQDLDYYTSSGGGIWGPDTGGTPTMTPSGALAFTPL